MALGVPPGEESSYDGEFSKLAVEKERHHSGVTGDAEQQDSDNSGDFDRIAEFGTGDFDIHQLRN